MSSQVPLAFRIAADLTAFRANLKEMADQVETTKSAMQRMANSLDGSKLIADANAMVKVINDIGGASKLTETEQARVNATVTEAIEKYRALGQVAPAALTALAESLHHADDENQGFFAHMVAGVASGELLAHAFEKIGEIGFEAFKKAAEALPELIEHTIQTGNQLFEMSLKTGASVENLSKLRYVASQTGVDFDSFGASMFKMEKFLGATGEAAVKAQDTLDHLGLSLQTLKNEKPDEAFIDIISALEKIPNRADQAAAGAAIFSKGFKDMAGLAQENIHELMEEAEKLGLVMSTDTAAAAHAAEVGFKSLEMQLEAVGMRIGAAFLPAVIGLEQNIGVVFKGAIDESNNSLQAMGGGNGFLATVAKAMGSGNAAIAAQVQLYEALRDTLISVVRGGVEPTIGALAFLMQEWDAGRVLAEMVLEGYQGITYGIEQLVLWTLKLANITPGSMGTMGNAIAAVEKDMNRLYDSMAQSDATIQKLKKSETEWADGAKSANASIETSLTALGSTHTDVAAIIQRFADTSRNAYGGVSDAAVDAGDKVEKQFSKKLASLVETLDAANAHQMPLIEEVKLYGQEAAKTAAEAQGWGITVAKSVQDVADAFTAGKAAEAMAKFREQQQKEWAATALIIQNRMLEAMNVTAKSILAGLQETNAAQQKYNDYVAQQTSTTTQYQLLKIQEWEDAQRLAFKGTVEQRVAFNQQIEALAKAQVDALYIDNKALVDNSTATLQETADKAWTTYEAMAAAPENYSRQTIQHFHDIAKSAQEAADGTCNAWSGAFSGLGALLSQLASLSGGAFGQMASGLGGVVSQLSKVKSFDLKGGIFAGAMDEDASASQRLSAGLSAGVSVAGDLVGAWKKISAAGGEGKGAIVGMTEGAKIGTKIFPVFGTAIGAAAGAIVGFIKNMNVGRNAVKDFASSFGGFDQLHVKLQTLGADGEQMWIKLTQQTGRSDLKGAQATIEEITKALAGQNDYMERLPDLMTKYGLTWEQAGQQAKQAHLDEIAAGLIQDFSDLTKAGFDVDTVTTQMSASVDEYVQQAMRTGTEIPAAMKPLLQKMIDLGTLTDEAGNQITDLGSLSFAETLTQGFSSVVDAIKQLTKALTGDLGGALDSLSGRTVDIGVKFHSDDDRSSSSDTGYAARGGYVGMGRVLHFDSGGRVPSMFAPQGTDTVPAMLTPGEIILNAAQQKGVAGAIGGGDLAAKMDDVIAALREPVRIEFAGSAADKRMLRVAQRAASTGRLRTIAAQGRSN